MPFTHSPRTSIETPEPPEITEKLSRLGENLFAFLSSKSMRPRIDREKRGRVGVGTAYKPISFIHPRCGVPPLPAHLLSSPHLSAPGTKMQLRSEMQLRSVAGETHAARTGAGGDLYSSPGKRASRLNFFHVYSRTALQRLLPAPAPAACPSALPVRCRGPAPSRAPREAPTWPGQQPSPAGLSVPPPRCSLGLAPADPQGRGREQTRVGGAGAEAEGRAQREEAAEPRSPGRPLPLSIPASGRRAGRGRRSPASGGRVL